MSSAYTRENMKAQHEAAKKYVRVCDCCEEKEATRRLVLSDADGVILDQVSFCDDCQGAQVVIKNKRLDY